jgi:hypothetical protein
MPRTSLALAVLALSLAAGVFAQESAPEPKPAPEAKSEPKPAPRPDRNLPTVTLQVQLVVSRFQGEKKLASLPYTLLVAAMPFGSSQQQRSRMRMGVDTPVPKTAVVGDAKNSVGTTEVQYRTVGTNVDCWASDFFDGRYQLHVNVENSSALVGSEAASAAATGMPLFRRFETSVDPILRVGQSVQAIASTDPVTGEVVKIDVTLNAMK